MKLTQYSHKITSKNECFLVLEVSKWYLAVMPIELRASRAMKSIKLSLLKLGFVFGQCSQWQNPIDDAVLVGLKSMNKPHEMHKLIEILKNKGDRVPDLWRQGWRDRRWRSGQEWACLSPATRMAMASIPSSAPGMRRAASYRTPSSDPSLRRWDRRAFLAPLSPKSETSKRHSLIIFYSNLKV